MHLKSFSLISILRKKRITVKAEKRYKYGKKSALLFIEFVICASADKTNYVTEDKK